MASVKGMGMTDVKEGEFKCLDFPCAIGEWKLKKKKKKKRKLKPPATYTLKSHLQDFSFWLVA